MQSVDRPQSLFYFAPQEKGLIIWLLWGWKNLGESIFLLWPCAAWAAVGASKLQELLSKPTMLRSRIVKLWSSTWRRQEGWCREGKCQVWNRAAASSCAGLRIDSLFWSAVHSPGDQPTKPHCQSSFLPYFLWTNFHCGILCWDIVLVNTWPVASYNLFLELFSLSNRPIYFINCCHESKTKEGARANSRPLDLCNWPSPNQWPVATLAIASKSSKIPFLKRQIFFNRRYFSRGVYFWKGGYGANAEHCWSSWRSTRPSPESFGHPAWT